MSARNAGQNVLVRRSGHERAVLEHQQVGAGALGHHAVAMEHRLAAAALLGGFRGEHAGDEVQRFDVAILPANIRQYDNFLWNANVRERHLAREHEQVRRAALRKRVGTHRRCAGNLKIELLMVALHAVGHRLQNRGQLRARHGERNPQKSEACFQPVEVFFQRKETMVVHANRLVHPVPKVGAAIQRGDFQLLQRREFAVVIPDCVHVILLDRYAHYDK
ncbi:hypothetical protein SDC9_175554 [bioreactor metagenome]|uniref:Uncharacterized protein n=1 Tax=bioreactor metagenome TaxID=1076179 RepID=A0A645GN03_9ZZZZ